MLQTFLVISSTAFVVVGTIAFMVNVLVTKCFTDKVPTGDSAMGLVVLFFTSAVGIGGLMIGTWLCIGADGFAWLTPHAAVAIAPATLLSFGISIGGLAAVFGWMENHKPTFLIGFTSGLLGPIALAVLLSLSAWGAFRPGELHGVRLSLVIVVAFLSILGYVIAIRMGLRTLGHSSRQRQAIKQAELEHEAEWARRRARPPLEALREDYAQMSDQTPLWAFVASLPDQPSSECRQFIIARALKVPNFQMDLQRTLTANHPRYRHGCLELIRFVPEEHLKSEWKTILSSAITITIQEMGQAPGWLSSPDASSNPKPVEHIRALILAAQRVDPETQMNVPLGQLREQILKLPAGKEKDDALNCFPPVNSESQKPAG